jgi:hypothetical protein
MTFRPMPIAELPTKLGVYLYGRPGESPDVAVLGLESDREPEEKPRFEWWFPAYEHPLIPDDERGNWCFPVGCEFHYLGPVEWPRRSGNLPDVLAHLAGVPEFEAEFARRSQEHQRARAKVLCDLAEWCWDGTDDTWPLLTLLGWAWQQEHLGYGQLHALWASLADRGKRLKASIGLDCPKGDKPCLGLMERIAHGLRCRWDDGVGDEIRIALGVLWPGDAWSGR